MNKDVYVFGDGVLFLDIDPLFDERGNPFFVRLMCVVVRVVGFWFL